MKRFFNFLLFVSLLAIAVGSLQTWKDRRYGRNVGWTNPLLKLIHPDNAPRRPEKFTLAAGPSIDLKDVNVLAAMSRQRITLARAVVPSVVSIVTSRSVAESDYRYQFFHGRSHGGQPRTATQLGSGAIVSKEGHIVTNNHVIEGMDEIAVKLSDGRERTARLIGTDLSTDVAVLKIDADNLAPLPFGDSDQVEVGETVMAVGNPYGWEESVTQGIISAKGRRGSENISDLFQIDAAITPGHSGGPLVNVRGELIGLNEAIYSRSGGWQGVGFAIPSATVSRVVDGILKTGRVIHSYLGIRGAVKDGPVLVASVMDGSPAAKAAIQPGDVIQKFNHKTINAFDDLQRDVAEVGVDSTVPVELLRNGKPLSVNARIAELPPQQAQLAQAQRVPPGLPPGHPPLDSPEDEPSLPPGHPPIGPQGGGLGSTSPADLLDAVKVREVTPEDARRLNLPANTVGVQVTSVASDSAAADKLKPGDVIETVNQEGVGNLGNYARLMRAAPADQPLLMSVVRDRTRTLVVISPE